MARYREVTDNYYAIIEVTEVMVINGSDVGEIIETNHPDFEVGEVVCVNCSRLEKLD